MANLKVKDADGNTWYIAIASGAGSSGDPYIPQYVVTDGNGSLTVDATALTNIDTDLGASTDAEATGNGSLIAVIKRLRTLLNAGLPAALGGNGGLKVEQVSAVPAGTNNIGDVDLRFDTGGVSTLAGTANPLPVRQAYLTALQDAVLMYGSNAGGPEPWQNNQPATILASSAQTASYTAVDQQNFNAGSVYVTLDVTAVPTVVTTQLIVEGRDPASGKYFTLYTETASAAIRTTTVLFSSGSQGTAAGGVTATVPFPLPRIWRPRVVHSTTGTFTYSLGANYIVGG